MSETPSRLAVSRMANAAKYLAKQHAVDPENARRMRLAVESMVRGLRQDARPSLIHYYPEDVVGTSIGIHIVHMTCDGVQSNTVSFHVEGMQDNPEAFRVEAENRLIETTEAILRGNTPPRTTSRGSKTPDAALSRAIQAIEMLHGAALDCVLYPEYAYDPVTAELNDSSPHMQLISMIEAMYESRFSLIPPPSPPRKEP